ncbi:unnamed protein product [Rotaria sordida]|uniref:CRIM domain-containing protein n=1 Tax=Rotaria sordida TaxID=392033 RepID=A0A814BL74_9BILA|nr:unnamed protein product [Rotaria sordida]
MSLGGGDLQVILRRIRHGFIVCDDSELCDKIISQEVDNEQRRRNLAKSKGISLEKTDLLNTLRTEQDFILDELSHSPEWTTANVQVRRVRCETLGRLSEIKTENEAKRTVKIISWQDPSTAQTNNKRNTKKKQQIKQKFLSNLIDSNELFDFENDIDDSTSLFQRRTEPILPLKQPSPLTALIQSTTCKQNPFANYAKFDGTPNISSNQAKKFTVHFKFQKQKLPVIVSSNATVTETIGFACYKYTMENLEPILTQKDPSKYSLYIGDDDGEAEEEFPPLTNERAIGQYDFPHLVLIEQVTQGKVSTSSIPSTSDGTYTDDDENYNDSNEVDDDDDDGSFHDSSRSITPPSSEHRKSSSSLGKSSTNVIVQDISNENDPINDLNRLYESLNQKSYIFDYYLKLSSSKNVKLRIDVSGEQVRLDLLEKTSKLPWQSMSLTTQRLVDCNILNKDRSRKRDRTRVYLVFESQQESSGAQSYETYELESTIEIAEQFRDQILNIIKLKNPQGHDTYEQHQQQRENTKKRRSFFNILGVGNPNTG